MSDSPKFVCEFDDGQVTRMTVVCGSHVGLIAALGRAAQPDRAVGMWQRRCSSQRLHLFGIVRRGHRYADGEICFAVKRKYFGGRAGVLEITSARPRSTRGLGTSPKLPQKQIKNFCRN